LSILYIFCDKPGKADREGYYYQGLTLHIMLKYLKIYFSIFRKDTAFRKSAVRNIILLSGLRLRQMFRARKERLIIINLTEHMGDVLAAEPISRHIRQLHPHAHIAWCVNKKFEDIVRYNPHLNDTITVTCIAEWIFIKKLFTPVVKIYDLHLNGRSCGKYKLTNKNQSRKGITIFNYLEYGNLLQVFAATAGLKNVTDETPVFHFSKNKNDEVVFPFNYIIFHPSANDPERNWHPPQWTMLLNKILDTDPSLHVVEIGLESVISSDSPRFHNLTGRYNLQQLAHIIKRAELFIGVESGFGHFANALGTKSIILIGHYQHYRNYQVYSGRFAQGKNVVLHYHPGQLNQMKFPEIWPTVQRSLNHSATANLMRG
jgi:heptosyltransferase-3